VNSDGSFVIQTSNGLTITVDTPIQIGATLTVTGLLNQLQNVLSQVSSINTENYNKALPLQTAPQPFEIPKTTGGGSPGMQ